MADNKKNQTEDAAEKIESAIGRTEMYLEKHGKTFLIVLIAVVLCLGAYFGYQNWYKAPKMEKATASMAEAQRQFAQDSFAIALKGNTSFSGFEEIAKEYSSTPQGNLAKHYAGICCLNMGDYKTAIEYFESFSIISGNAGEIISANNFGLMGDAYVESGDMQNGLKMYEKAAAHSDNFDTAPTYLKKASMINESMGNFSAALEQLKKIKYDYPANFLARDIDKYIAMIEQKM